MGILFVDTEHPEVIDHPESGLTHRAKVAATNDRLAALAGTACHTRGFATIDLPEIARLAPDAIVIGGNTTDWARFDFATMHGLFEVIRTAPVPILGICAGQQLIGYAHGAAWGELGTLGPGELDPDPRFAPGRRKERGFLPVELDRRCLLFRGLDRCATFFQSHYWQLTAIPNGFDSRGSSPWSAIQAIERRDHPVFGVQFHPERYDETYPDGATVLRSFFSLT